MFFRAMVAVAQRRELEAGFVLLTLDSLKARLGALGSLLHRGVWISHVVPTVTYLRQSDS